MRAVIGILSLLVALLLVGVLVKKQLSATRAPVPALQAPAAAAPTGTVRAQGQQVQEQVREQVQTLMQQPRPMPEDEQ
ncbi:hypothetical protein [Comamonas sp. NLF-1-9]|uniref:hypothetical protein n=1 Tax=Comamonas sp. NLF-1-9 TaxID=2853163 RepID=UPI001C446AA2|nr:hypothetical protein [Comamonas sp. NLF-1-9]QXL85327.1 hypothetical protein KUD94_04980 [Comamonas sp. NLF-1-9]